MRRKRTAADFTISQDGTKISYTKSGDGQVVIAIFGAACYKDFIPVKADVKVLSAHFTVVSYDRRGRGASHEHRAWSLEREVQDIKALIEENGGSAYLYGHSSGAVLALEAAMALGEMVRGVMIYDASYVSGTAEKVEYRKLKSVIHQLLSDGKNAQAIKTFLIEIGMPKPFAYLLPFFPGWNSIKRLAPTLLYDIALTEDTPPTERLQQINKPVLVMAGTKNPESIHKVYQLLVDSVPHNQHHLLEGRDHMAGMKHLTPYMIDFVRRAE